MNDHYPQSGYFGDTHLHTSWSADAGMAGATLGPEDAYRVSRGDVIQSQAGGPFKLIRPLGFVVVADHAENLGLADYLNRGDPLVLATDGGRRWYDMIQAGDGYDAFIEWVDGNGRGEDQIDSPEMAAAVWDKVVANAEGFNEPGVFTAFIGYEWTSDPNGNNLHRNVIFRDGGDRTRQVLAIPHNGNLSNGMMFELETFAGNRFDAEYARLRAEYERVVEVTQLNGTGEAHSLLSPEDAFADFEIIDASNLSGSAAKTTEMLRTEYTREALRDAMAPTSIVFRSSRAGSTTMARRMSRSGA